MRFLSVESLVEEVVIEKRWFTRTCTGQHLPSMRGLKLPGIDWVICGEADPKAKPMQRKWARSLKDQCRSSGIAFFMSKGAGESNDLPRGPAPRGFPNNAAREALAALSGAA